MAKKSSFGSNDSHARAACDESHYTRGGVLGAGGRGGDRKGSLVVPALACGLAEGTSTGTLQEIATVKRRVASWGGLSAGTALGTESSGPRGISVADKGNSKFKMQA